MVCFTLIPNSLIQNYASAYKTKYFITVYILFVDRPDQNHTAPCKSGIKYIVL